MGARVFAQGIPSGLQGSVRGGSPAALPAGAPSRMGAQESELPSKCIRPHLQSRPALKSGRAGIPECGAFMNKPSALCLG